MLASSILYVLFTYSLPETFPKTGGIFENPTTIFHKLSITFGSLFFLHELLKQVDQLSLPLKSGPIVYGAGNCSTLFAESLLLDSILNNSFSTKNPVGHSVV